MEQKIIEEVIQKNLPTNQTFFQTVKVYNSTMKAGGEKDASAECGYMTILKKKIKITSCALFFLKIFPGCTPSKHSCKKRL